MKLQLENFHFAKYYSHFVKLLLYFLMNQLFAQ